jgi:hypothetical protein
MKLIEENPYRIVGILSNASANELDRQKTKILRHATIGRQVSSEYDFPFLSIVDRTHLEKVQNAFVSIEQREGKVKNSIFWFLNQNPFDETAFNYLKNGDKEKAIDIWERKTVGKEVTSNNYSCFNNLATIKLLSESKDEIKAGIETKIKFIESQYFSDFVQVVSDLTYTIDRQNEIEKFINNILSQLKGKYSNAETLKLFSNCNGSTHKYVLKKFTEEPLNRIENQIDLTTNHREENKSGAFDFGNRLYLNCKSDLDSLKTLLGVNDLKYKLISDNLAKEVMQCGIDYFLARKEAINPSQDSLKLLNFAQSIAISTQIKDRIKENIEGIEEWNKTAPIKQDLDFITLKLKNFQNTVDSIENARAFVLSCKTKLQRIKTTLGSSDEYYINISSIVVSNTLGMIIQVVNDAQSGIENNRSKVLLLVSIVSDAVALMNFLDSMEMDDDIRRKFTENKITINSMNAQLEPIRRQMRGGGSDTSGGTGCYIATMAYGDYNHPQVLHLRTFRDDFLGKSLFGRTFIKIYYRYSPFFVEKLKNETEINEMIRLILDQIIKIIRKK